MLVRSRCVPLFFFQIVSLVGIRLYRLQTEWMKHNESKRVHWFETRFQSLVYLYVVYIIMVQLYWWAGIINKHSRTVPVFTIQWNVTSLNYPKMVLISVGDLIHRLFYLVVCSNIRPFWASWKDEYHSFIFFQKQSSDIKCIWYK